MGAGFKPAPTPHPGHVREHPAPTSCDIANPSLHPAARNPVRAVREPPGMQTEAMTRKPSVVSQPSDFRQVPVRFRAIAPPRILSGMVQTLGWVRLRERTAGGCGRRISLFDTEEGLTNSCRHLTIILESVLNRCLDRPREGGPGGVHAPGLPIDAANSDSEQLDTSRVSQTKGGPDGADTMPRDAVRRPDGIGYCPGLRPPNLGRGGLLSPEASHERGCE